MKYNYPGLAVAVAILAITLAGCSTEKSETSYGDATSIGTAGNPEARSGYEWMMLRDPATGKIPARIRERELAFAATLPQEGNYGTLGKTAIATWQSRGPWNVGGRTRAFAIDLSNENILIAGSTSGGMWRSADGGQNWVPTTPEQVNKSVSCLAQDTRDGRHNVWYYGTGEAYGASAGATGAYYLGNGIYKSTDGGQSWSVLPSTSTGTLTSFDLWSDLVWNIAINPADTLNDAVYAAAHGGIYRSLNGGTTWNLAKGNFSGTNSYFTDIVISQTGVIYVSLSSEGAQKGLYRSTDGFTFVNITPVNFPDTYKRVKIGISPSDEDQVYFLGNTPGFGQPDTNFQGDIEWNSLWKYTYITGDGSGAGGNWDDRSANLPTTGGPFDKFSAQGSYNMVVKVKPDDPNTVFIGGTNLYRSTSGFADDQNTTFIGGYLQGTKQPKVQQYPNQHPDQHELVFYASDPDKMISANDGGMWKTEDNTAATVNWTSLNNGYLTTMFYTCAVDHASTNHVIVGGAQDNGSWFTNSISSTAPWVTPRGGDGSYCAIADNGSAYYLSTQNGKMMKAKLSASGTVDSFARIDPIGAKGVLFINPYVLDPNNNNILYFAGGKYLWRNNDLSGIPYAGNWDSITTNWVRFNDSVPTSNAKITALAVSKKPANRVYYGTSSKRVFRVDNANVGTPKPVEITSNVLGVVFPGNAYVSCIAVNPENADELMVVFSNYGVYSLYHSSNGGTTWAKMAGNLEANSDGSGDGPSLRWASIMPVNNGTIYMVGTSVGLFATTKLNGINTIWAQQAHDEIGSSVTTMIDFRLTDGLVAVATHSHGIYSAKLTSVKDVLGVEDPEADAVDFRFGNYPNPFSKETNIHFELKTKAAVSLKVFDATGKLVSTLVEGPLEAGEKSYVFKAHNLYPGIYYCRLQAGTFTGAKRLLLVE
jgi:hypothetical protein